MFTPESLLQIATGAETRYKGLLVEFPPGTSNDERNDARRRMEQALVCAEWMQTGGHTELTHVGPFGAIDLKQGDRIRIRKGAVVFSTAPNIGREGVTLPRAQVVTVRSVDQGYVDTDHHYHRSRDKDASPVRQARVRWSGAGSYWRWTDITNVEPEPVIEVGQRGSPN